MKNKARKNPNSGNSGGKASGSNRNKGGAKSGAGSRNTQGGNAANGDIKKQKERSKERDVLYQVKTKRDAAVLKAFITFTYRVYHPGVTVRLIFFGLLIAAPAIIIKITWFRVLCLVAGLALILLGLFRQNISLAMTKRNDPDYQSGAEFTYEFTNADASFYRDGELINYINKYKDIMAFYYDEDFYYLATGNRDFYILPKSRFTVGDAKEFDDFIYQKSKKTCRWIPNNFKDQLARRRAYRQMNSTGK